MRYKLLLCTCLAIATPQFASADLPMSKQALGQVEGILNFCAQVDPGMAKHYQEQSAMLLGKATAKDLSNARNSGDYRQAYEVISAELAKIDKDHAAQTCNGMLHGQ